MKSSLKISILLNLGLLTGLIFFLVARPKQVAVQMSPTIVYNSPPDQVAVTPFSPVPVGLPPFHWSQLDAKDYHTYVKNLRAIGCPEPTVRAIVHADVHAAFSYYGREMRGQLDKLATAPWPTQFANVKSAESLKSRMQELPDEEIVEANDLLGLPSAEAVASLASTAQTSGGGNQPPVSNRQRDPLVAQNETALASGSQSSISAAEAPTQVAATVQPIIQLPPAPASAAMPLVFQPVDPAVANLTPSQMQVVNDLRQEFATTFNGYSRDPQDPAYQQAWQQALSQSDRLLEANLGQIAFNQYWDAQWDAQHPVSLANQATPAQ